ncbi:MAG: hypothetical protein O3B99_00060 [Proteobacteria bacterium]|nr:hypothetical protein [Pseudomonadota bacterium]MDA1320671.1 hypothetical protein [Pseudomonadota bacterium]
MIEITIKLDLEAPPEVEGYVEDWAETYLVPIFRMKCLQRRDDILEDARAAAAEVSEQRQARLDEARARVEAAQADLRTIQEEFAEAGDPLIDAIDQTIRFEAGTDDQHENNTPFTLEPDPEPDPDPEPSNPKPRDRSWASMTKAERSAEISRRWEVRKANAAKAADAPPPADLWVILKIDGYDCYADIYRADEAKPWVCIIHWADGGRRIGRGATEARALADARSDDPDRGVESVVSAKATYRSWDDALKARRKMKATVKTKSRSDFTQAAWDDHPEMVQEAILAREKKDREHTEWEARRAERDRVHRENMDWFDRESGRGDPVKNQNESLKRMAADTSSPNEARNAQAILKRRGVAW